ncbi:TMEM175 family protein [Haladaptatus sp. DFWS20]|uniref:TMEM175 family protein n=1 Tax=Haladaptatus sp. DFWS20 TaxID=3403467 RepID=UPI003EBFCC0B
MSEVEEDTQKESEGLSRLTGFSDGVFAIAITLLILNIELPERTGSAAVGVYRVITEWPDILAYVISFLVIGNYWIGHHSVFEDIEYYDRRLLWLNIIYLMFIAFIPFSTALLGDFPGSFPVIVYAGTLALTGIVFAGLWRYAWANGLLDETVDTDQVREITLSILIPSAIFTGSVLVALISARLAMYSWLFLFLADPIQKWLMK